MLLEIVKFTLLLKVYKIFKVTQNIHVYHNLILNSKYFIFLVFIEIQLAQINPSQLMEWVLFSNEM